MRLVPVNAANMEIYIDIGRRSYNQHYRYLWSEGDTTPYIKSSFIPAVVNKELKDPKCAHFIIMEGSQAVGIIKLIKDAALDKFSAQEALLLEKIYILKEYTGRSLGKKSLDRIIDFAKGLKKRILWLDTMVNGKALPFYLSNGFKIVGKKDLSFNEVLEEQKAMYKLAYSLDQ